MDKWLALQPNSPTSMLDTYREAYAKITQDSDFLDRAKKISEDFTPMLHEDVAALVNALGSTPPEATEYTSAMLRRQGLEQQ
jgi:dihydroxyacetone kinase